MPATFEWDEANGAGQTITHNVLNANWKNQDSSTDNYASFPITAGNNSFEKWLFGHFSGTWNQILNGRFAHTATAFGTGISLFGQPSMAADGNKLSYTTPSTTSNANLTVDMTSVTAIGSGQVVWFSATSQTGTMTASVSGGGSAYTNYLTTQLRTTGSAAAGDTATVTLTLQYNEN